MIFRQLFDRATSTYTYLLADRTARQAVLIDPTRASSRDRGFERYAELAVRDDLVGRRIGSGEVLEPMYREVLLLRDVEGLTAPEVADLLGIGVDAVKSRLHRARTRVRERVAPLLAKGVERPEATTSPLQYS